MKKFFTNIPLQKENDLREFIYEPRGNERLRMEGATSFPIIPAISAYAVPGEEFRVIAVVQNNEDARRNLGILEKELETLCTSKGLVFPAKGVECIPGPNSQIVAENIETFQNLIDFTEDGDELFACITYGTKPMSMALLTVLRYAYRIKSNVSVSCIVYGEIDRSGGKDPKAWRAYLYDETALIQLDEVTRMLANHKVRNPEAVIARMLRLGTENGDETDGES